MRDTTSVQRSAASAERRSFVRFCGSIGQGEPACLTATSTESARPDSLRVPTPSVPGVDLASPAIPRKVGCYFGTPFVCGTNCVTTYADASNHAKLKLCSLRDIIGLADCECRPTV